MHLHVYWASIFILPRKVLNTITGIYKNYFWDEKIHTTRVSLIAWTTICKAKRGGGLGINDRVVWNEAAINKYVWHIDNLWVRWVNHIYIKEVYGW